MVHSVHMHERIRCLFMDPPPRSAIARARDYGMDLTLLARNLTLSPEEQFEKAERALDMAREMRHMREQARQ
jgi:hypothetical protein